MSENDRVRRSFIAVSEIPGIDREFEHDGGGPIPFRLCHELINGTSAAVEICTILVRIGG